VSGTGLCCLIKFIVLRDQWLKTGTFKTKPNSENDMKTNFNTQQFLDEEEVYSPLPSNVSSNSVAHSS
jgi:hypothetical protein